MLAPTSGDAQTAFFTQPDIAERSSRPYLQGRLRARWGSGDSKARSTSAATTAGSQVGRRPGRRRARWPSSMWTPIVRGLELRGEAYTGQALAGLGGGGIGQNFGVDSTAVTTTRRLGSAQRRGRRGAWEIGAGAATGRSGRRRPRAAAQRLRNLAVEGHTSWRRAPVVLGAEVRLLRTRYGPGLGP